MKFIIKCQTLKQVTNSKIIKHWHLNRDLPNRMNWQEPFQICFFVLAASLGITLVPTTACSKKNFVININKSLVFIELLSKNSTRYLGSYFIFEMSFRLPKQILHVPRCCILPQIQWLAYLNPLFMITLWLSYNSLSMKRVLCHSKNHLYDILKMYVRERKLN